MLHELPKYIHITKDEDTYNQFYKSKLSTVCSLIEQPLTLQTKSAQVVRTSLEPNAIVGVKKLAVLPSLLQSIVFLTSEDPQDK